jgi:hydrogenase maturation protease
VNLSLVEKIADAVLYEGYILYPYRPSSVKNQQRWNFGALCPEAYSVAQSGTESWTMQTEVLIETQSQTTLDVKVRFLHLVSREVLGPKRQIVPSLEVNGQLLQTWQEAIEREVIVPGVKLNAAGSQRLSFSFPANESTEDLRDAESGELQGIMVRKQQALAGSIEVRVADCGFEAGELRRVTVQILNETPLENAPACSRDEALMRSFVSTHTILNVQNGEFVSLLDPPEAFREAAAACSNLGTYPVLVGEDGSRDCMLSSPIILYDYPQIAPESPGSLFDGTEIDEILTLRIMTLTDDEKREMRGADDRARQILERTELLPAEQLMKMHGAMKSVRPMGKAKEHAAGEAGQ